jgi:hypothetical protein
MRISGGTERGGSGGVVNVEYCGDAVQKQWKGEVKPKEDAAI